MKLRFLALFLALLPLAASADPRLDNSMSANGGGATPAALPTLAGMVYGLAYGMKCDDSTDDTAALQSAINAAEVLGNRGGAATAGGILILPAGVCRVSSTLTINSPLTITGAGQDGWVTGAATGGTWIRNTNASIGDLFAVRTLGAVRVSDVFLYSGVSATGGASYARVHAGGAGYAAGDTITLTGGTFTAATVIKVTHVTAGAVDGIVIQTPGVYSIAPSSVAPVAQGSTSGGGAAATFDVIYANSAAISLSGPKAILSADAASGATSITVATPTGCASVAACFPNASQIEIEQDDGTYKTTTVSGTPAGQTITLTAGLTFQATTGHPVYNTYGRNNTIENVRCSGSFWDCVRSENAQDTHIIGGAFSGWLHDGWDAIGGALPDGGGSAAIVSLKVNNGATNSNAAYEIHGGGAAQISNGGMGISNYGLLLNAFFGATGTWQVSNFQIEQIPLCAIKVHQSVSGVEFGNLIVSGNEFSNVSAPALASAQRLCIDQGTPTTAPKWIRNIVFSNNLSNDDISAALPMVDIQDGTNVMLSGNALNNNTATGPSGYSVTANAANVIMAGNAARGMPMFGTMNWPVVDFQRTPAPNLLINGGMDIDQANEGATTAPTAGGSFAVDQWAGTFSDGSTGDTEQQVTDAPSNAQHSLQVTIGVAGGAPTAAQFYRIQQKIEANALGTLGFGTASARTLSVSLQIKSSVAGTYGVGLWNTAPNRSFFHNCVISATGTWTPCAFVVPGDTTGAWVLTGTGVGMFVVVSLECGSNYLGTADAWQAGAKTCTAAQTQLPTTGGATFQMTNIKLEMSDVPTPYVSPGPTIELARAQRYYAKTFPQGTKPAQNAGLPGALCVVPSVTTAGSIGVVWRFPVEMRVAPTTVTVFDPSAADANWRDTVAGVGRTPNIDPAGVKSTTGVEIGEQTTALVVGNTTCIHAIADARL